MSLQFTVVDAFTNKPFSGNPAAVVILPQDPVYQDAILLGIAAEMNLSETAYIIDPPRPGKSDAEYQPRDERFVSYGLRWFTPQQEFPLCGHATLASASVLFADETRVPSNVHEIHFSTLSGILKARRTILENAPPKYELEFPAADVVQASDDVADRVREVVVKATQPEVGVIFVGVCSTVPYEAYLLVEIDDNVPLGGIKVDSGVLGTLAPQHVVTVMCQRPKEDHTKDFHYRVFAEPAGLLEDPVCGSATSFASKYLAGRTAAFKSEKVGADGGDSQPPIQSASSSHKEHTITMQIGSVSRRGGELELVWEESTQTARIRGNARVASRGEIYV